MKMYQRAFFCIVVSSLALNTFSLPSSFAANKTQLFKPSKAGRVSTVVANTILSGVTPPKSSVGIDGDFYIDTKAMFFYGPKSKSHWPSPTSIRGPQGQTGANGSNGTVAKPSANVVAAGAQGLTGSTGQKGEQGVQGVAGPAGSKGETGPAGSAGPSGLAGPSGAPGSAGSQGIPGSPGGPGATGAPGSPGGVGATGAPGSPGGVGATGATGSAGATGTTGSAGSSNVMYGPVNFVSPIEGVVGTAQTSSNFGTFEAGKSYVVRIQIQTVIADGYTTSYPLALDLSVLGVAPGPSRSISYVVSNGSSFNLSVKRNEVSITAEVILDGSQVASSYALSMTVTCGANTTSDPVTLTGRYHAILVGQVTQTS